MSRADGGNSLPHKQSVFCELTRNIPITDEIFRLDFAWPGTVPHAGQFFMVKPQRSAVFLGRPISVARWESNTVTFLIMRRGRGTRELAALRGGEKAELIGPLGNAWTDFLPAENTGSGKPVALVGGGIGIAPLEALAGEETGHCFDLYAGFRTGFQNREAEDNLLGLSGSKFRAVIIATEDGTQGLHGRIPDFVEAEQYAAVCACGPELMLQAVAVKCRAAGVPCFISLERRMACGVGACRGCTVRTLSGNRHGQHNVHGHRNVRCCADGPVFNADEVVFDA